MSRAAVALVLGGSVLLVTVSAIAILVNRSVQRAAARYAHEVRAALAGACVALEVSDGLEQGVGLGPEQRTALALGEIRRAGRLMRSLEETAALSQFGSVRYRCNMLVARMRRRRLEREGSFDPREETLALAHVWRMMARAGGRSLRLDWRADSRSVLGRRDHYVQALSNLIGNAMRHGAGDVHVRGESNDTHLRITVTDEGAGLPVALGKLTRGRSRRRHGHGLPVTAWAVRRLGGSLTSAPAPRGARIVIELPLEHALVGDGASDWYTRTRADLDDLDANLRDSKVIPFRRPSTELNSGPSSGSSSGPNSGPSSGPDTTAGRARGSHN